MVHDASLSQLYVLFLTGAIPKGLTLRKFSVRCLCLFCFMFICRKTDFVVFGEFVFDDLCAQ